MRTRWAEVDVGALRENAAALRAHVGDGVALMAMVKANGYGHGSLLAAAAALDGGATWLGVCCAEEALALRDGGVDAPLLVTGWSRPDALGDLLRRGVDITVYDDQTLDAVLAATRPSVRARVHVKVDTGMHRLGAEPAQAAALVRRIVAERDRLVLAGVFSHLADADGDDGFTAAQHGALLRCADAARAAAPSALVHIANSAATLRFPGMHHDLVRVGIALYGYPPVPTAVPLRPAMSLAGTVTQVRTVAAGDTVGYGRTWRARGGERVATVALGYADGVARALGNRGALLVRGHRAPIVGRVSMDQTAIDVSGLEVQPGDAALLLGACGDARQSAADVAAMYDTIPNEVLCAVSARVQRVPVGTTARPLTAVEA